MGRLESGATHVGRWHPVTTNPTEHAMTLMATRIIQLERRVRRLEAGVEIVGHVLDAYTRFNHRTGTIIEATCDLDAIEAFTQALDDLRSVIAEVVPRP